jgi:hypothetical protein
MLKQTINAIITIMLKPIQKRKLDRISGTYFISPLPTYVSQFVGIYPQSIRLGDELTNKKHLAEFGAKDSEEFSFWSWRNCGIACVKMILDAQKKPSKTMMDLTREGIALGGYILYENDVFVDKGWFHHSLVQLLNKYGTKAKMKKWQSIYSISRDVLDNKLVIISVTVPGRSSISLDGKFRMKKGGKMGGHLLLTTGVTLKNGDVEGIFVHDPRGLQEYQQNTWIPNEVFSTIFSGRTIVVD